MTRRPAPAPAPAAITNGAEAGRPAHGSLNAYVARPCPSCGSGAVAPRRVAASSPAAESLSIHALAETWAGFFHEQRPFFTYRRCANCRLAYCPTYLSEADLTTLYGRMDDNTFGLPIHLVTRTQEQYLRTLARYTPLRGTYLEIGPDIGLLTRGAVARGHFERVLLCEPNELVHSELLGAAGSRAEIRSELDEFTDLESESADVIVMVHVLDHLFDPKAFLSRLRSCAAPNAVLLVVTHDESSLLARVLGRKWPPYALQHPQLYDRSTLEAMLAVGGFEVVGSTRSVNHLPVGYLCKHLAHAAGLPSEAIPPSGPAVPLPLGNLITVARAAPAAGEDS